MYRRAKMCDIYHTITVQNWRPRSQRLEARNLGRTQSGGGRRAGSRIEEFERSIEWLGGGWKKGERESAQTLGATHPPSLGPQSEFGQKHCAWNSSVLAANLRPFPRPTYLFPPPPGGAKFCLLTFYLFYWWPLCLAGRVRAQVGGSHSALL